MSEVVEAATDRERACRECGCTDLAACVDEFDVACHWVEWDLCSMCAPEVEARALGPYARGEDPELDRIVDACWQNVVLPMIDRVFEGDEPVRHDDWYCGKPTCWICVEDGRVPKGEAVVERHV